MTRAERIEQLRRERAFHNKLGRRKRVVQIDAILEPLVREEMAQENLAHQLRQDIEWIGRTNA
jgi:hypothetical protein